MSGLTQPTYTMWVRRSPVYDASIDVGEFNLDKARIGGRLSIDVLDVNTWSPLVTHGKFTALANHIYGSGDQDLAPSIHSVCVPTGGKRFTLPVRRI